MPQEWQAKPKGECNMKLLLVDGMNLLFQMFFGMPARIIGKNGQAIQGTLGFVGALIKIIKMTEPTHIAVLFDGEHENPRNELLSEYKANRIDYTDIPAEANPFSQLEDVYAALNHMGISHFEIADNEADDAIAAYALTYGKTMEVVIASFDSDFFQLINENVTVLRYRGDKTVFCDSEFINNKFAIMPAAYAEFKALIGDKADNIKGAERIGSKTASALLKKFGSLASIIENAGEIEKPSIRESVMANAERLKMNYSLIKLDSIVAVPFSLEDLSYAYDNITTTEILRKIGVK